MPIATPTRLRSPLLGLDIGTYGVRAAQVVRGGGGYRVTRTAWAKQRGDGASTESAPTAGHESVRQCLSQVGMTSATVAIALSTPDIEYHTIEIPQAVCTDPTANLDDIVRYELERLTTKTASDLETRHWRLPTGASAGTPNTIGVAAPRSTIMQSHDLCSHAGLTCGVVDTASTALCRLGEVLTHRTDSEIWGMLDIGHRQSRLALCVENVPVLVRDTGPGGDAWTERIATSLSISHRAGEIHKIEHGIATGQRERAGDGAATDELATMILGILRGDLTEMATEIKRSYEYVLSCYPNRQIADLVLTGSGALLKNLPAFLTRLLGIQVTTAGAYLSDDSCRLDFPSCREGDLERVGLAVGLAMGGGTP